jgi:hypothetical protein
MPSGDTIAKFRIKTFPSMFSGVDIISADVGAVTVFGFPVTMNVINDSIFFSGINKISEEAKESVKIFPNPAHDKIYLKTINDLEKEFKIIDTSGRIVKSGSAGKEINIAGLDNGVYYIEIISNDKKYHQRIIKQ